jgi:asparagine synthase (glutamine-hydrolysing)
LNPTGELSITADSRIDNRVELLASLGLVPDPRQDITDSDLILRAYERWGEHCPEKLLGDFAFAIWDQPRLTLFCARDHFGVKPFYYFRSDQAFFFASEIKALLCLAEVPRYVNEMRVADFLVPNLQDTTMTFYKDILRLPPAHRLTVCTDAVLIRRYWSLDPAREVHCRSNEEYAEGFREIFTDAVRVRVRCGLPLGSMLSGGLDSSSIVCVARQLMASSGDRRLHTFSAVFPNLPECDESPFIQTVLDQGRLEPHRVGAGDFSLLGDLNRMLAHEDEPFFAPNLFLHWALYKAAKEQDVRVILDGIDGDITVSHGIGILQELARTGCWIALAREILGLSQRFQRSPWRILQNQILRPLVPESVRRVRRLVRRNQTRVPLLSQAFARRIGWTQTQELKRRGRVPPPRTAKQDHYWSLTQGLIPYSLEVADHAAMAFSIEPRYPFFDKRLAEYCLALPTEQKIFHGWTRMVMRRGMANILPEKVQWRGGKADLSHNFFRSLLTSEGTVIEEMIRNPSAPIWEYVDQESLRRTYYRTVSSGDREGALALWQASTLDLWLQQWDSSSKLAHFGAFQKHSGCGPNGPSTLFATTQT